MADSLPAGTLVAGRFEIQHLARSGGTSTVFRALDRETGRPVALKLLHAGRAEGLGGDRFAREAQLLAGLRHPRIVSYVAHGHGADGVRYLAMEWLDGEDLAARLARRGLSLHESLRAVRYIAEALAPAHRRGIAHRDLKPSNVFLREGAIEGVILLDFGIARRVAGDATHALTQTGVIVGTPDYMAPEQARGERDLEVSADIFSLGCILFECLIGRAPFAADHLVALLAKILFEDVAPLRELRPELPQPLEALVGRMLAKVPQTRPADADALLAELAGLGELPDAGAPAASRAWTTLLTTVSFVVMARTERKALFLRGMPTELVREAKAAAARRGATIATIVAEALARSLGVNRNPQDGTGELDREMAWYRKNRAALLRRYRGEYVAIVEAKVVDHGRDFSTLAARVFDRFGSRNIYMPRVEAGEPEARIRSPRRARP